MFIFNMLRIVLCIFYGFSLNESRAKPAKQKLERIPLVYLCNICLLVLEALFEDIL